MNSGDIGVSLSSPTMVARKPVTHSSSGVSASGNVIVWALEGPVIERYSRSTV